MLTIVLETRNAAFTENPGAEAARILRAAADWVEAQGDCCLVRPLRDVNGNRVGKLDFDPLKGSY